MFVVKLEKVRELFVLEDAVKTNYKDETKTPNILFFDYFNIGLSGNRFRIVFAD